MESGQHPSSANGEQIEDQSNGGTTINHNENKNSILRIQIKYCAS